MFSFFLFWDWFPIEITWFAMLFLLSIRIPSMLANSIAPLFSAFDRCHYPIPFFYRFHAFNLHQLALYQYPRLVALVLVACMVLVGCSKSTSPSNIDVVSENHCADSRYITISNTGSQSRALNNWTIEEDMEYPLPDIVLYPGVDVKIWSGPGTNDSQNIYVGRTSLVWDAKNVMYVRLVEDGFLGGQVELHWFGGQACYPALGPP